MYTNMVMVKQFFTLNGVEYACAISEETHVWIYESLREANLKLDAIEAFFKKLGYQTESENMEAGRGWIEMRHGERDRIIISITEKDIL